MNYYLGIDLGTTNFKAGIFDEKGLLCGLGRHRVHKISDGNRCELSTSIFWNTLRECIKDAVCQGNIDISAIRGIGYASQANSFILLNSAGQALTPLILWPDNRAERLTFDIPPDFMGKTGLGIIPDHRFAFAKIRWFQRNDTALWAKTAKILSISDYLAYSLTGQMVGDFSTTSMTGMFDRTKNDWWEEHLTLLDIRRQQLPDLARTGACVGKLTSGGARLLGLSCETQLFLGGLDHHIAAVGARITESGYLCESTGTVLACVDYSTDSHPQKDVCIAPGMSDNRFFRMTFDDNGASALEWYQKNHAPEFTVPQLIEKAETALSGKLTALPCVNRYNGLEGFVSTADITFTHGDYVRAILVSTARSLSTLVVRLKGDASGHHIVSTGGGSRSPFWLRIKEEVLQSTFHTPASSEVACMGAAMLMP